MGGALGLVSMALISVENGRCGYLAPTRARGLRCKRPLPRRGWGSGCGSWTPQTSSLWFWWFEAAEEPWVGFSEGLWELALSLGHFTFCDPSLTGASNWGFQGPATFLGHSINTLLACIQHRLAP